MSQRTTSPETKLPKTFLERVKEVSLSAAGIGFLIGDAAFFAADRRNKDATGSMTGLIYLGGAAVAARYGKENHAYQLQEMHRNLRQHLVQHGVAIPQGAFLSREEFTAPHGLVDQVEGFFRKYPAQILNGMFAVGGGFKVASAFQKDHGRYSTMAYGGLVMLAGLIGLLVPEKAPDVQHPPTTMWGQFKEKIQAHPLRLASAIYLINNGNLVINAFQQRKEHLLHGTKPGYQLTFLTACAYIVSNGLMGFASKNRDVPTNVDGRYMVALENAAAEVLAAQPERTRDVLVQQVAEYLAAQPHVTQTPQQLAQEMHARIAQRHTVQMSSGASDWQQRVDQKTKEQGSLLVK